MIDTMGRVSLRHQSPGQSGLVCQGQRSAVTARGGDNALRCDRGTAGRTTLTATPESFTGFLFPLLQTVFRMSGHPAIRQQGFQGGSVGGRTQS